MLSDNEIVVTILDRDYLIRDLSFRVDPVDKKLTLDYTVSSDGPLTEEDHSVVKEFISAFVKESINAVDGKDSFKESDTEFGLFS